jgi:hypothetical protein
MTDMLPEKYRPYFAAYTELEEASRGKDLLCSLTPAVASLAIAKILTVFEIQIDDEWRHDLIRLGGGLLKLQRELDGKDDDVR